MARKSPWQQFSDNFSSVYGTFQDLGKGIETARIMGEKPEEVKGGEIDPNLTTGWAYGGKTYDKEITADELRGLQYNRLGDVMAKYGDPTGAMAMRTSAADIKSKAATLEAQQTANEIALGTKDALIELATLRNENLSAQTANTIGNTNLTAANLDFVTKTMDAKVKAEFLKTIGLEWDNESKKYKAILEKETLADKIEISGLKVEAAKISNINETIKGDGWKINNDGNLVQLGVDKQTADSRVQLAGLKVDAQLQANINAGLEGTGLVLNNRGKLVAAETAEALQESDIDAKTAENLSKREEAKAKSTAARLKNNANVNLLNYGKKLAAGDFKEPGSGKKWLEERWSGDPETLAMIKSLDEMEINNIMRGGAVFMKQVEAATVGVRTQSEPALLALIDGQDGIEGNLQILDSPDGTFIEMVETDENGENPQVIARGDDWELFTEDLVKNLDPMRAVQIEHTRLQVEKLEAQVVKLQEVGLDKDQVSKDWNTYLSGVESERAKYGHPPLEAMEIATMRYNFIDNLIHDAGKTNTGLKGTNDSEYTIKQTSP